jgi:Domain of unknown function (DUF4214)
MRNLTVILLSVLLLVATTRAATEVKNTSGLQNAETSGDGYFDNAVLFAATIDLTGTIIQTRDFSDQGDVDWIKFFGVATYYYNIETTNLGARADTVISIYGSDGVTLLHKQDDRSTGQDEVLSWQAPANGIYYVKISQYEPSEYGSDTGYNLRIYLPRMLYDGLLIGTSSSNNGDMLSGVYLSAESTLCNPVYSLSDGSYIMPCSTGSFNVTASLDEYNSNSQEVSITAEGNTLANFVLQKSQKGLTSHQVSQLYVSIFGRASEGEGHTYWQSSQYDMKTAADTMLATGAAQAYFAETLNDNQKFIEFIYENTLGKTYSEDPAGVDYWVGQFASGKSKGEIVVTLIDAVMDPRYAGTASQNRFINKVAICNYTADKILTIPDMNDLSAFTGFISTVTDDISTVTAAKLFVDAF